jgi:hypothetical protein
MVHKISTQLSDVGTGTGKLVEGLYPVATLPVLFGAVDLTSGTMKGVAKRVEGKKTKKKKKSVKRKHKKKKK